MNIPESIAMQGVDTVNEYKNKQNELENLNKHIYNVANEIKQIEEEIKGSLNKFHWNKPHTYYSEWKRRDIAKRHFTLTTLTEKHRELSYKFIDLDNRYTSLCLELYTKGWLPDWMMDEYTKLGF